MSERHTILQGIEKDIQNILYRYMKTQSFTYTEREKEAEQFLVDHLSKIPYFREHPEHFGTWSIPGDPLTGRFATEW